MAKKVKSKKAKPVKKGKAKKSAKPARKSGGKAKAKKAAKSKAKAKKATKKKVAKKSVKKAAKKTTKKVVKKKKATKKIAKKVVKKVIKKAVKKVVKSAPKKKKVVVKKPEAPVVTAPAVTAAPVVEQKPFVAHSTSLKAGMTAPYFEGKDQHGNTIKSSDLIGKTVILYFYPKDDTPGCTAEACSLRDEYQYLSNNNYAVIGVSGDDEASHLKFADKYNLPFSLLADTDHTIIKAYDVWGPKQFMGKEFDGIVRTTFVIDADGIIKDIITKVDTANHAKQILGH